MNVLFSDGEVLSSSPTSLCGTSRPTALKADTSDECAKFRYFVCPLKSELPIYIVLPNKLFDNN